MKKLLEYIIEKGLGIKDYEIKEGKEESVVNYELVVPSESIGLVIGKKGRTIKIIRNILKVRAILDKVRFNLTVSSSN